MNRSSMQDTFTDTVVDVYINVYRNPIRLLIRVNGWGRVHQHLRLLNEMEYALNLWFEDNPPIPTGGLSSSQSSVRRLKHDNYRNVPLEDTEKMREYWLSACERIGHKFKLSNATWQYKCGRI